MVNSGIKLIADHYGLYQQRLKLIEEMGELQTVLMKFMLSPVGNQKEVEKLFHISKNIIEEIADVEIMLEQLKYLLKCEEDVCMVKNHKINRQLGRIECSNGTKNNNG